MRRFVEPWAWAVAAAAPLLSPLIGAVAMAVLGVAALVGSDARRAVRSAVLDVPAAVWVGAALVTIVHALRGAFWVEPVAIAVWTVLLIAASAQARPNRRTALAVGAAAAILAQAIAVAPAVGGGRAAGWVGHPNLLATGAVLAAVLVVLAAPRRGRGWVRVGVAALALVAFGVALATGSRGMWVGATLGVAAWALLLPSSSRSDRGLRLALLGAIVAAGVVVGAVRGFGPADLLRTDVDRSVVQGVALSLAAERPVFGQGGGSWAALAARVEPSVPAELLVHAHSVPLHLAARGGALALAAALALAIPLMGRGARALRRRSRTDPTAVLAVAVAAGVLFVQSLLDLVVQHPTVYVGAWLVLLAARDRWRGVSSEPVERRYGP